MDTLFNNNEDLKKQWDDYYQKSPTGDQKKFEGGLLTRTDKGLLYSPEQQKENDWQIEPMTDKGYEISTVQGRIKGLLDKDNPYIKQARQQGEEFAASRGLLNSTLAAGASQREAYKAAYPIAQADSQAINTFQGREQGFDLEKDLMEIELGHKEQMERLNLDSENRRKLGESIQTLGQQFSADFAKIASSPDLDPDVKQAFIDTLKQNAQDSLRSQYALYDLNINDSVFPDAGGAGSLSQAASEGQAALEQQMAEQERRKSKKEKHLDTVKSRIPSNVDYAHIKSIKFPTARQQAKIFLYENQKDLLRQYGNVTSEKKKHSIFQKELKKHSNGSGEYVHSWRVPALMELFGWYGNTVKETSDHSTIAYKPYNGSWDDPKFLNHDWAR